MTASGLRELLSGDEFTDQELDVLHRAALGDTAAETAERMHYSTDYAKDLRKRAVAKLNARNLTHAVALSLARGIVNPDRIEGAE